MDPKVVNSTCIPLGARSEAQSSCLKTVHIKISATCILNEVSAGESCPMLHRRHCKILISDENLSHTFVYPAHPPASHLCLFCIPVLHDRQRVYISVLTHLELYKYI